MEECNIFDTGMAEPKLENWWPHPFVFFITMKYLKYKKYVKNSIIHSRLIHKNGRSKHRVRGERAFTFIPGDHCT